jgi:hypothetical protein
MPKTAEAARLARRAAEFGKNDAVALCFGGLALAYVIGDLADGIAGRLADVRATLERLLRLDPTLKHLLPLRRSENLARAAEGLRMAGLPEQ